MEKRRKEMAKIRGFLSNKMNDWKNINPKDPSCIRISILKAIKDALFWNDRFVMNWFRLNMIFHSFDVTRDGSTNHREMEQLRLKTGFQCNSGSFSGLDRAGLGGPSKALLQPYWDRRVTLCSAGHIKTTGHIWPTCRYNMATHGTMTKR